MTKNHMTDFKKWAQVQGVDLCLVQDRSWKHSLNVTQVHFLQIILGGSAWLLQSVVLKSTNICSLCRQFSNADVICCDQPSDAVIPTGWRTMVCYGWHSVS